MSNEFLWLPGVNLLVVHDASDVELVCLQESLLSGKRKTHPRYPHGRVFELSYL